ncbi:hypothetical protein NITGR_360036 [Nitrospina gracilis 3/211]|uniref:Helix-turn-helix domain-containing protein n=1 Tax=Nitrospina gracilis (strain 3/211) TaxID=1266370 RepID=M1YYE5_NITG3|nr:excisionase family DNA binding protein [Nitrospina sp. Nb-3]CCQ90698.1 hypothetical protein NITGR_360036 [Nitrospina gracilis 3/211]
MSPKHFLSIKELSEYIGIKPKTLYSWVAKRVIPHYRIMGLVRFHKGEIDIWLKSCHENSEDLTNKRVNEIEDEYSL